MTQQRGEKVRKPQSVVESPMELLAVAVFITGLLCSNAESPPALAPADCNDAQIEKDAGVALDLINKHRRGGYILSLLRVADAYTQHLENASVVYLTLDVVDTECLVLSGKHWSSCGDRPFYRNTASRFLCFCLLQEFGQCKAVVYINQFSKREKLYGYNCTMSPVPPQLYECKDCPVRIAILEDAENYNEEAKKLLQKYNQESNQTHYFKLEKVQKIFTAIGSRTAYVIEFTIKETSCLQTTVPTNVSECELLHSRDARVGFCRGKLIKDTKDPNEVELNFCEIYDIPSLPREAGKKLPIFSTSSSSSSSSPTDFLYWCLKSHKVEKEILSMLGLTHQPRSVHGIQMEKEDGGEGTFLKQPRWPPLQLLLASPPLGRLNSTPQFMLELYKTLSNEEEEEEEVGGRAGEKGLPIMVQTLLSHLHSPASSPALVGSHMTDILSTIIITTTSTMIQENILTAICLSMNADLLVHHIGIILLTTTTTTTITTTILLTILTTTIMTLAIVNGIDIDMGIDVHHLLTMITMAIQDAKTATILQNRAKKSLGSVHLLGLNSLLHLLEAHTIFLLVNIPHLLLGPLLLLNLLALLIAFVNIDYNHLTGFTNMGTSTIVITNAMTPQVNKEEPPQKSMTHSDTIILSIMTPVIPSIIFQF
ncbi:hypothetical protein JD844_007711 [Phrynosoma platyrhinos]|uniref:Histidine-rich glycoprotein n=1 Tax=Phrynosoma platyrhinos TaxID=52577 RepID=A0ABQ7T3X6_PHRPL|nr:hypothetical protein JD844_007711 [Phrynosoma platyrhinos]